MALAHTFAHTRVQAVDLRADTRNREAAALALRVGFDLIEARDGPARWRFPRDRLPVLRSAVLAR